MEHPRVERANLHEWTVDISGDDETGGWIQFRHTCGWRTWIGGHDSTTLDHVIIGLEHGCLSGQGEPT